MSSEPVISTDEARYVVGIDLGTTNTAVASAEPAKGRAISDFAIPQLVAEGETAPRAALPSTLYIAGEHDVPAGALELPWREDHRMAIGVLARKLGQRVAGRVVTSAKSWLCHAGVDREAAILPWGSNVELQKLSPVAASARILEHVRDAWDATHPDDPLRAQSIVLTVPASFDDVARQLTVRAAEQAGLSRLRLIEEPQASIYAWIAAHPDWRERLAGAASVLVVDVGGGTTDFSLMAVKRLASGVELERLAVGEHLLLGGDNVDLALARRVAERDQAAGRLDAARWQQLVALCREAKERLLGDDPPDEVPLSIPGRGRDLIGGAIRTRLTRQDALDTIVSGFLPDVAANAVPEAEAASGLVEFGLPFARDPAITRHLAHFLTGVSDGGARPEAVLFNGGAVKPDAVRARVLDAIEGWCGTRPTELEGAALDLAVARGAVAYGLAIRGMGVRIAGGAARAYYLGIDARDAGGAMRRRYLCIAPRGMEEGSGIEIFEPEFEVKANEPVRFPLFASRTRVGDRSGELVDVEDDEIEELAPLSTVLRFGRALVARDVPVHLRTTLTETGTLEVSCLSKKTDHVWRLSFDLRARTASAVRAATEPSSEGQELVIGSERIQAAAQALDDCFSKSGSADPVGLTRSLEEALDAGKDAWPLACIRSLWDGLFALEAGRTRTPAHEARWLNLAGFLLRPGWGEERDSFRAEQLWRLFDRGLAFSSSAQGRAEWWTLWKRVAGGLSRAQQQVLLQEIRPSLVPGARKQGKPARWKGSPQEVREMWQVAGSLERCAADAKLELAGVLFPRVASGKASDAEIWAFGRLAARSPVHGPANEVIAPDAVTPWLEKLVQVPWQREPTTALAVAQIARVTGDRARDLDVELRERARARLAESSAGKRYARWVSDLVAMDVGQQALVLAESLPSGLRLASLEGTPAP